MKTASKNPKHRITIMLNDDNSKVLRDIQSQLLKKSHKSISFSHALNTILRSALSKKQNIDELSKLSEKILQE